MKRTNTRGQGLVEYLILVCLIAVSAIWIVSTVGKNIAEQYANISNAIRGESAPIDPTQADRQSYEGKGLDDFMRGARKVERRGR